MQKEIEILICDNGHEQFQKSAIPENGLVINHFLQTKNVGLGNNINSCILNASGTFIWLVSDDDHFLTENLTELIQRLKVSHSDIILLKEISENFDLKSSNSFSDVDKWWTASIFISACIYRTSRAEETITNLKNEINPTYQQVLIALMLLNKNKIWAELWKNIFVQDTLTAKNYNYKAAISVRIIDLLLLEKQILKFSFKNKQIENVTDYINSNIVGYTYQLAHEFNQRNECLYFIKSLIKYSQSFLLTKKRCFAVLFALITFSLGLIHNYFSRFFVASTFKLLKIPTPKMSFDNKSPNSIDTSASRVGYGHD